MVRSERSEANWALAMETMPEIDAKFGPEENCRLFVLAKIAECKNINCRRCGHQNVIPSQLVRKFLCKKCKKEISLTARTLFHKVQLFRPRVIILNLIARGIILSINQLAELTGASNDILNNFWKKVALAADGRMKEYALEILSEFCQPAVSRRTQQTPAGEPPFAEEIALQNSIKKQPKKENEPEISYLENLSEGEKFVFDMLASTQNPMSFDELCNRSKLQFSDLSSSLMSLELQGIIERKPGDKYEISKKHRLAISLSLSDPTMLSKQQRMAETLVYFVKDYYQGIGRKYEQLYAALYWLYHDREWSFNSLLELCVSTEHIANQEVLDYVTPLSFKVVMQFGTS